MKRQFGRNVSPFDSRDFNLRSFATKGIGPSVNERKWAFPQEPLDQGETPHCVGFSMANFGINLPVFTPYTNEAGHKFYYKCKVVDGNPGDEDGSTIRSAAKVLKNDGIINAYAFAYDLAMIKWWVLNRGPVIVGTTWTSDMMIPDADNMIYPTGARLGGHAYLINEWTKNQLIGIQNSWGNDWGIHGKAYILASDFEKLFKYDGEAMAAVELEKPAQKDCWFTRLVKGRLLH